MVCVGIFFAAPESLEMFPRLRYTFPMMKKGREGILMIPDIASSTKEQRLAYIRETFRCRNDCDSCGLCQVFRGQEPMIVFADYIEGKRTFQEIMQKYRH